MLILLSSQLSYIVYKSAHSVMRGVKARAAQLVMCQTQACADVLPNILEETLHYEGIIAAAVSWVNHSTFSSCRPLVSGLGSGADANKAEAADTSGDNHSGEL